MVHEPPPSSPRLALGARRWTRRASLDELTNGCPTKAGDCDREHDQGGVDPCRQPAQSGDDRDAVGEDHQATAHRAHRWVGESASQSRGDLCHDHASEGETGHGQPRDPVLCRIGEETGRDGDGGQELGGVHGPDDRARLVTGGGYQAARDDRPQSPPLASTKPPSGPISESQRAVLPSLGSASVAPRGRTWRRSRHRRRSAVPTPQRPRRRGTDPQLDSRESRPCNFGSRWRRSQIHHLCVARSPGSSL